MIRFRQFCAVKQAFGKQKGDTVNWDKIGRISTAGTTLTETATIPRHEVDINQGTLTINEWGNSIWWTGKMKTLSEINLDPEIREVLAKDHTEALDKGVEAEMDKCKYRAVATASASTLVWTTNSAATSSAAVNMDENHFEQIVNYLKTTLNAPKIDGQNYMAILTGMPYWGLWKHLQAYMQYTKYPYSGEVGRYYQCRTVEDNNSMDGTIGTSNITGEAYFFGKDPVAEAFAQPVKILMDSEDFDRHLGVAWWALAGFAKLWDGDPDSRIVKFDSG
jgi:N4-gp56 family major capsid protein